MEPDTPSYANQLAHRFDDEADAARLAGVDNVVCPSDELDRLVAQGERLVYVVTLRRTLIVAPQLRHGFEVRHPVLAGGEAVLAAGEVELAHGGEDKIVLELNNKSGHYGPPAACLGLVAKVLVDLGYAVPPDVILPYPGD